MRTTTGLTRMISDQRFTVQSTRNIAETNRRIYFPNTFRDEQN